MSTSGGLSINIKADLRAVDRDLQEILPEIVAKSQANAINLTINRIKKRAINSITKSVGFQEETVIKQRTRVYQRAKVRNLTGGLFVGLSPLPVGLFGVSGTRSTGLTARGKLLPGTFAGTLRGGPSKGKSSHWHRETDAQYPIRKTMVPISGKAKILRKVGDRVMDKDFQNILNRALVRNFRKYARTA